MPAPVTTIDQLQEYLTGVAARADQHAHEVREVALAIAGAIVLFKDAGTDLQILVREGNTGNVLWAHIGGERYALSYSHEDRSVEVRAKTTRGEALASFSNATPIAEVIRIFTALRERRPVRLA